jgi:hypothetical protein
MNQRRIYLVFVALVAITVAVFGVMPRGGPRTLPPAPSAPRPAPAPAYAPPKSPAEVEDECRGPGNKWVCPNLAEPPSKMQASSGPAVNPKSWGMPAWWVDGEDASGCASDGNSCTSGSCGAAGIGPCLTVTQIQQARWGGNPNLAQATTITALSPYLLTDFWSTSPVLVGDAGAFAFAGGNDAGAYLPPYGVLSDAGLSSPSGNATEFQGASIATGPPTASEVYIGTSGGTFALRQATLDDLGPAFAITSFAGGSTVEIGLAVVNPAFTASYSSAPTSAQITNTDAIDSPLTLTSPFTSGTVVGSFVHTSQTSTTFTLTAIAATTKTATASISWLPRVWTLSASAIATNGTVSGNSLVLNNGAGTAPSAGIYSSVVGQSFAYSPSGNSYLTLVRPHAAGTHSYKDENGFAFPMTTQASAVSVVNQYGATVSEDFDQSTNLVAVATTLTVEN